MSHTVRTLVACSALLAAAGCHAVIDFEQRTFVECAADEVTCEENGVVVCVDGLWSEPISCEGVTPTCNGGACRAPCGEEGGPLSCHGDLPRTCVDGFWQEQAPCAGAWPVCVVGVCEQELLPLPISGGHSHTCAVGSSGSVYCWGLNAQGQLGVPGLEAHPLPARVQGLPEDVVEVALGWHHTCARTLTGDIWCWGLNSYGELGAGEARGDVQLPAKVMGIPKAAALRASAYRTCILSTSGEAWCFGVNNNGQIALPVDEDAHDPAPMPGLTGLADVVMGTILTCGVRGDGSAACVGESAPIAELALDDIVALRMNDLHHCAVREGGKVSCWGIDQFGELGNGAPLEALISPDELAFQGVQDASTSWRHTCLLADGDVSCAGYAEQGQLGNGQMPLNSLTFVPVALPEPASDITSNFGTTCAKVGRRDLYCWGQNASGGIGDGTFEDRPTPVKIDWDAP